MESNPWNNIINTQTSHIDLGGVRSFLKFKKIASPEVALNSVQAQDMRKVLSLLD